MGCWFTRQSGRLLRWSLNESDQSLAYAGLIGRVRICISKRKVKIKNMFLAIFGAFLGTFGGLGVALIIERVKQPRVRIILAPPSDQSPGNVPTRFLHLTVENCALPLWMRGWLSRQTATSAYGRIRFLYPDGKEALPRPMDIRWTGSPQPPEFVQNGVLHGSTFDFLRFRDIHTSRSEGIDVCVKFEGDSSCHGFTNTSYVHNLKHPDYKLKEGRYIIEVSVYSGQQVWTECFVLRNDWPRKDFTLEGN